MKVYRIDGSARPYRFDNGNLVPFDNIELYVSERKASGEKVEIRMMKKAFTAPPPAASPVVVDERKYEETKPKYEDRKPKKVWSKS